MRQYYWLLLIYVFAFSLNACRNRSDVDVSGIDLTVEIKHFERDLFAIPYDSLDLGYNALRASYGNFIDIFPEQIIGIGNVGSVEFSKMIRAFITDSMICSLYRNVENTFTSDKMMNRTFTDAFRRFSYYFPKCKVPEIYTFISGFNLSVGVDSNAVFIGLDRYLGDDVSFYSMLGIPKYMQYKMTPQKVTSDVVRAWVLSEFPMNDSIDNMMTNMIWEGELVYVTSKLLPEQSIDLIMGFTPEQLRFCQNNEKMMWAYLIERKILFSTNTFDITKYIHDAPFTSGLPQESPGRAMVWLGYRIVKSFMDNNPHLSLSDLMSISDYNQILSGAKYRP